MWKRRELPTILRRCNDGLIRGDDEFKGRQLDYDTIICNKFQQTK
jgi:hypothetical protein